MFRESSSDQAKIASGETFTSVVVISGANVDIRYMMAALTSSPDQAEVDLLKELLHVDTRRVIGANIDNIKRIPVTRARWWLRQQYQLDDLRGARTFDLLAAPLKNVD